MLSELKEKVELPSREGVEILGAGSSSGPATKTLSLLVEGLNSAATSTLNWEKGGGDIKCVSFVKCFGGSRPGSESLVWVSTAVQTGLSPQEQWASGCRSRRVSPRLGPLGYLGLKEPLCTMTGVFLFTETAEDTGN